MQGRAIDSIALFANSFISDRLPSDSQLTGSEVRARRLNWTRTEFGSIASAGGADNNRYAGHASVQDGPVSVQEIKECLTHPDRRRVAQLVVSGATIAWKTCVRWRSGP